MADFIYYVNGEFVPPDKATLRIDDLALLRGYGVFDFFRAIDGKAVFLDDHLDRLENSVREMDIEIDKSRQEIKDIILQVINLNKFPVLGIKVVVTGGCSPDGYTQALANILIIAKPFTFIDPSQGLKLISIEHQREIPEVKTTNYVVPIRSLKKQMQNGADDVVYIKDGIVSESSKSNIFLIKNGTIITPDEKILPGVTRKHILKIAKPEFKIELCEVGYDELMEADEVFISSSSKRIAAVTNIDGKIFTGGLPGKITKNLQELFLKYENTFFV